MHPTARLALKILGVSSADELAMIAASVGLASNLSALRALATDGIQRGHMSLHARSVASAAGALGDEVELIAARIAGEGLITVEAAERALTELRQAPHPGEVTRDAREARDHSAFGDGATPRCGALRALRAAMGALLR